MRKAMMIAAALFALSGGAYAGENSVEPGMEAEFPGVGPAAATRSSRHAVMNIRSVVAGMARNQLGAQRLTQARQRAIQANAPNGVPASSGRWIMLGPTAVWVMSSAVPYYPRY